MSANLSFYDGMTTQEIQDTLIKSSSDLISLDAPNYQYVASRLLLFAIRKDVFNTKWKDSEIYPPLKDIVERNIEYGVYDKDLIGYYDDDEWDKLNSYLNHNRDMMFAYAGLQQVVDKYLVQDRSSGKLYETPQFMYILISAVLFKDYPKETRLNYVKRYYDAISHLKSIYLPQLWQGLGHLFDNLLVAFWWTVMILFQVFSLVTWLLVGMLHRGLELVLMLVGFVESTLKFVVEKYSIQELYLSSRNLNPQSDVVHKMVLVGHLPSFPNLASRD